MRHGTSKCLRSVALVAVAGLAASGLASTGAGAQPKSDPGVTAKAVKIGYIFSETGVAGSTFKNAGKAFQARIDRANAQGGVNGRKIETEIVDDASSAANLTAAQDLVQNRKVFAVVNNSSFAFLSYRYLLDQDVPMIGGGFDGTYYGQKGNEDIISALGNSAPYNGLTYDGVAQLMKKLGATKVGVLAYGASASSSAAATAIADYAVPAAGLKSVYLNTSVDFGTSDVGPLVLGIKNSGADAIYLPMVGATNFAIVQGLAQNGVEMKANVLATGYGQDLLDSPVAATLQPNTLLASGYKPVELKDKATKQFQTDLKKYAGLTGVPDFGEYLGYITAELAVLGLEHAGKTPTRRGFIDGLHQLGSYDAAGLSCQPVNISLGSFGQLPKTQCGWYVTVKDGKFVVANKGKPGSSKLVGDPALIAQATAGTPTTDTATTTTAGP
jgi:ABC-type branched-subunit amino acid transport system substrate-binding protein